MVGEFTGGAVAADQQLAAAWARFGQVDDGSVVEAVPPWHRPPADSFCQARSGTFAARAAAARRRHEQGGQDELRRRTGESGPVRVARVMDEQYDHVSHLTLGGRTARAGHSAILTDLEWAFRILTPVEEPVARAVAQRDRDHVAWSSAR